MSRKPVAIAEPVEPTTPAIIYGEGATVVPLSRISYAQDIRDEGQLAALRNGDERLIPVLLSQLGHYVVLNWVPAP